MKKIFVLILAMLPVLVSCQASGDVTSKIETLVGTVESVLIKTDRENAEETFSDFIEAVKNGNSGKLASLFSKNVQNNISGFNELITELLNFIEGEIVSYEQTTTPNNRKEKHNGKKSTQIFCTFIIETSSNKYYVSFSEYVVNQFDSNDVGINAFSIINAKNWNKEAIYRNRVSEKSGIIIDRKNYSE